MANALNIPAPKEVLRRGAQLPAQVLPSTLGRPLTQALTAFADSAPPLPPLPQSFPTPEGLLPQGFPVPPSPKLMVQRLETTLPAGAPRISGLIPDAPAFGGKQLFSTAGLGDYRPLESTGDGRVKNGGYRSV